MKPEGTSINAGIGNGQPTIIHFTYGSGNVTLFSYHPDILIDSLTDEVVLREYVYEDQITWNTGNQTQDEINLYSWNIVHASLQLSANEKVTAITALP
ncbi:MAG: hypothetical protein HYS07_09130 [Chlamydiae bacterium]|nr:hypothetical protein [Chlamydiota bacterium]MBI3276959.1 hypothetical protein [Chlamydiota bacterium]